MTRRTVLGRLTAVVLMVGTLAGAVPAAPAAAGPQGSLRAADPTLVRDGGTWISLSTNESLSSQLAVACDPSDPVWAKGFAYIPYRTGPSPDQLGDCYAGDALPDGPGPWAGRPPATGMLQWAPSIAHINSAWFLFYAARRSGTGQQCIGVAAGDRPTGPGWLHAAQPLVCPSAGNWAIDPEIFYDRQTQAWYLLWRQDPGPCDSRIYIQRFDPNTATLTGTARLLISGTHPDLGFDEYSVASCPGGLKHLIENPTMVRSDSGTLWLFFSANQWDSVNYATGWALCGEGSPTAGGGCALLNSFDPASRNRPWWGASSRTAPTAGDARPSTAFPDLPGFGGLSLATPDPTATGIQRVHATAHLFWGGATDLRTQVVLRLHTSGTLPALAETEPVTLYGKAGTFGSVAGRTSSGQPVSTRGSPGFGLPAGRAGYFSAVAADGTIFTGGIDHNLNFIYMTADDMMVAAYNPNDNAYRTIGIRTTTGATSIPDEHGASIADVATLDGGNAVAFTGPVSWRGQDAATYGEWPALGILTKVGGVWQVAAGNQWTGGQLAQTNPPVSVQACPPEAGHPEASQCGGPNEMDALPASGHIVIAQYFSGLMAIDPRGPDAGGRFQPRVAGGYPAFQVKDVTTADPDDVITLAPRDVQADPTGVLGDERFALMFDAYFPAGSRLDAAGFIEFSYDARTGQIRPMSAPILRGDRNSAGVYWGTSAWYDDQGNLWSPSSTGFTGWRLGVYAKSGGARKIGGAACPFDPERPWEEYLLTSGDHAAWGQACPPDYDILQPSTQLASWGMVQDPVSHTIVYQITGGHAMPIRVAGSGRNLTFMIGQLVDIDDGLLPRAGPILYPLGEFDRSGRLLTALAHDPTAADPHQLVDQWFLGLDVAQLFDPSPVRLPSAAEASVTVQAEDTTTTSTVQRPGSVATVDVDSTAYRQTCVTFLAEKCADDGVPGNGFLLADDSAAGVAAGTTTTYRVWAPVAGTYRVAYRVRTPTGATGQIQLATGAAVATTPVATNNQWQTATGPAVSLPAGLSTMTVTAPAGSGGWYLNHLTLTRT